MTIVLADAHDIGTVAALQASLCDAIGAGVHTTIDLAAVTRADLAYVQVIEAARRLAQARGGSLALAAAAPPPVRAVLDRAGIADPFWTNGAEAA